MKILLIFILTLSTAFAQKDCTKSLEKTMSNYKFEKAEDVRNMDDVFQKALPCLGKTEHLNINIEAMNMYARSIKKIDFFENFETLYPVFEKNHDFFSKKVLPKMDKDLRKLLEQHYIQYKGHLTQNGNG